uniref:F-box protein 43 n=1 Tax=Seriola dumerili TaxID=41447 RepID=A0A3B4TW35_SERDU
MYTPCISSHNLSFPVSPLSISGVDSSRSLSPVEFNETPKENLRLSVTPKRRTRESVRFLDKESRGVQQPSSVSWCETPKVYKRDASLRHRLLISPCTRRTESSISASSEHWFSASFDSLDTVMGALASSTLKLEQYLPLSGRKSRLLFSQVRTSTLEDGKLHSGLPSNFERSVSLSDENSLSPVSGVTNGLNDSLSMLSVCEDSGFSSLTVEKSEDSSVDHDGSFQELLLSASRRNCETPNLVEAKRRSRFQRQHRLSTLKEGGSQSEEDPTDRKDQHLYQCHSQSKDDVFTDCATPRSATMAKPENMTPYSIAPQKAYVFAGQSPSLKEQLKSTAELAKTPVTFRTTMPLAGLIGRKMGLGKMDILTELKKRSLRHILAVILSHLTSEGIYRCGRVCKSWNEIIQHNKQANFRRRNHLSELKATLELGGAVHVPDAETRLTLLKRSALKTVQAQSRTSSYCTPQSANSTLIQLQHRAAHSGGSSSKREKFLEIAKTLFNDECLKPCPRCQHPARCHSVKGEGVCSRADCGFQFCTSCFCAFHGSRECGSRSVGRRKNDIILPGSAQSKRNVRRL